MDFKERQVSHMGIILGAAAVVIIAVIVVVAAITAITAGVKDSLKEDGEI